MYAMHSMARTSKARSRPIWPAGKLPTKLALTWDERISFILSEKLEVKRLAFLDLLKERSREKC
jgi:recombination associated protein RdgC